MEVGVRAQAESSEKRWGRGGRGAIDRGSLRGKNGVWWVYGEGSSEKVLEDYSSQVGVGSGGDCDLFI